LLLEVGLVDARKAARNHGHSPKEPRLQRGVLAAGALAVVPVADDAPCDSCVPVRFRDGGDCVDSLRDGVEGLAAQNLKVDSGFCAREQVVRDVLKVASVFVPGPGGRDVVGSAFAFESESVYVRNRRREWMTTAYLEL